MENPNPDDNTKAPPDPAPVPDPDPKATPLDPDEHIKDGIEVHET
jgi:hypothetical protein